MGSDNGKKDTSLRKLVYGFTQDTTFHGVRYITAETQFVLRRIVWTFIVLLAFAVFLWFMTSQLIYLNSNPKAVDVEVIYTNNVSFPAVTICNQNLFRTSATHKLGLHDIVSDSFKRLQSTQKEGDGFELYQDFILHGIGKPHATYIDITAEVCKRACTVIHGDSCCSLVYDRGSRTCHITPLELSARGVSLDPALHTDYYRRMQCEVKKAAECDFETDTCDFIKDPENAIQWERVNQLSMKVTAENPKYDHTTTTGQGTHLQAFTLYPQPNTEAGLVSPYILAERGTTCIQLYHQIRSGILSILVQSQTKEYTTLTSLSTDESMSVTEWERTYLTLPPGYWRIVIKAKTGTATTGLNIAIDDIDIGPCRQEKICKETSTGVGFSGHLDHSRHGNPCQRWSDVEYFLRGVLWRAEDPDVLERSFPDMDNHCRNPDNDVNGPWCFTDTITGRMEYCDIPACECRPVDFTCDNGRCIARELLCDGVDHCLDHSDETNVCNLTESVSCTFDGPGPWMCGYSSPTDKTRLVNLDWSIHKRDGEQLAGANFANAQKGDIITMVSPVLDLANQSCLHVDYGLRGDVHLDISYQGVLPLNRTHLCTIYSVMETEDDPMRPEQPTNILVWNATEIMIPSGRYQLFFDAVVHLKDGGVDVLVDNITLLDQNCSLVEILEIYEPTTANSTFEFTTYSLDLNETNNYTSPAYNETLQTTALPFDPVVVLHEAMAHPICQPPSNGSCASCIRLVGSETACTPVFSLVDSQSGWLGHSCENLGEPFQNALETCEAEATTLGANIFSYDPETGDCFLKNCSSDSIAFDDSVGNFEVYQIDVAVEPKGISCTFEDDCMCGYEFVSANIHDVWTQVQVEEAEFTLGHNGTDNVTHNWIESHIAVRNTEKLKPTTTRLLSPAQQVDETSCLSFKYKTSYVDYNVYLYWPQKYQHIMHIMHDGQMGVWHTASVTVPPGLYRVMFEEIFGEGSGTSFDDNGFDDVQIKPGYCWETEEHRPFDCTFDDDDYCGYKDVSGGVVKWIRSRQFHDVSPGGYYLRMSGEMKGKDTNMLMSPVYTFENISCIQFYYFMQGSKKDKLSTFSMSLHFESGERLVVWRVRSVTDNLFHFAQVQIVDGTFKLVFEMSGSETRGGIDDIVVLSGMCPSKNCTEEEYTCVSSFACISPSNTCDKMPNCDLGEDEQIMYKCGGNVTTKEEPEDVIEQTGDVIQTTDSPVIGSALGLREIYHKAGHQGEDLIYHCRWGGGHECSHLNFTKNVTDYGLCYTFNSELQPALDTDRTGARFGLALTMNIEQYEYMRGPQSDAGIKVFLHHKDDVPQVRDLGFSIAPGVHSLVAIRLNEAKNLPSPWGQCAEKPLIYYHKYVHSRCMRECELTNILEACQCRDAYMPGLTDDDPKVCNLTWYFSCAIPAINSDVASKECHCPKPCHQTIYEPGLSQAALSILSVDNILNQDKMGLEGKYHSALEARQRVEPSTFVRDLSLIKDISRSYRHLRLFSKNYLGDFKDSSLAKIWIASSTLVRQIFLADIDQLYEDLEKQKEAFNVYYDRNIQLVLHYIGDLDMKLHETGQLLEMATEQKTSLRDQKEVNVRLYTFFSRMASEIVLKCTIAHANIREFYNILVQASRGISVNAELKKYLPKNFTIKNTRCVEKLYLLGKTLQIFEQVLPVGFSNFNATDMGHVFKEHLANFTSHSDYVKECVLEYKEGLKKIEDWYAEVQQRADEFITAGIFMGKTFNFTEEASDIVQDEQDVEKVLDNYNYARISKMVYLRHFDPEDQSSTVLTNIDSFVNNIKDHLTDPLWERIDRIQHMVQEQYKEAFLKASEFELFFEPYTYYPKSDRMKIWRIPRANLENPEVFNEDGRELWKIWNRDEITLETFAQRNAKTYINQGLEAYCNPLLEMLDGFVRELMMKREQLSMALHRVTAELEKYKVKRAIDHKFVLDNFLNVDVYFAQLKHQNVVQMRAYDAVQFLGDVGGYMGLLLGGSVMTVFELLDLVVFHFLTNLVKKPDPEAKEADSDEKPPLMNSDQVCIDDLNLRYGGVYGTPNTEEFPDHKDVF